jgi:hypothetical protein
MPGMSLVRSGDVRQAHGTAIAPDGKEGDGDTAGAGTNVFDFPRRPHRPRRRLLGQLVTPK